MAKLTPMMLQYMEIKEKHKDCILFFRLGDFYEMFFEDALTASKELEITLTGRDCGQEEKAPMCGVPFHSAESYINKLTQKGYKVAICEQVEDPKTTKGIVKREVVRIVTSGTNLNPQTLDEKKNNYLMCLYITDHQMGVSTADVTTGDYYVTEIPLDEDKLLDEIAKYAPSELIYYGTLSEEIIQKVVYRYGTSCHQLETWYVDNALCQQKLKQHFKVHTLDGLGLKDYNEGVIAAGALLQYLYETQKSALRHFITLQPYTVESYLMMDNATRRNLELVETLREKQRKGSLLWVLDRTKTAMGARLLRTWIEQPLVHKKEIEQRLELVTYFVDSPIIREELREYLNPIYDLERLLGRISYGTAGPRDLIAFKNSLKMLPPIKELLQPLTFELGEKLHKNLDLLEDLVALIESSIEEDPPITLKDGHIIKTGYHEEVDRLRRATIEGKTWLAELERKERERTKIKNLKIKYNKVFGYYIEVTKSNLSMVPDNYIRKQTLANAERYITEELKEMEETLLGAEEKIVALEYELFVAIRQRLGEEVKRIKETAKVIATLDVLLSFAFVADRQHYVRPKLNTEGVLTIKDGRHPVVEKMMGNDLFVANDTYLDTQSQRIAIITGPNMAGKSTYMRQVALIVLMAQIGAYVPAEEANISIVDRIFTRVGASDDLASGQSTFMVEMTEVANILRNATKNSLLILDEIGRGTSTFDGLSIAWAVVEYISHSDQIGAKTLFATHYHELTELEGKIDGVNNYCISVKEHGDDIIFLRKIIKGGADQSYGIQVAKLAGVPEPVIDRAKSLMASLTEADIAKGLDVDQSIKKETELSSVEEEQLSLFTWTNPHPIIEELKGLNVIEMTPLEALNKLYALQKKIK